MGLLNHVAETINQRHLEQILTTLFPNENILSNAKTEAKVTNPISGRHLELDLWIPTLNLSFEFQDDCHYFTTWYNHRSIAATAKLDIIKRQITLQKGYSIVVVPFWWDVTKESLAATILFERPDLSFLSKISSIPIPLNLPHEENLGQIIPSVGELMYASFPTGTTNLDSILNPKEWWIGEKYDGIRVCWNPDELSLYTRSGNTIELPPSFSKFGCSIFLDGETWFGRGGYGDSQKLLSGTTNWESFRMIVFDKPDYETQRLPFEKRYNILLDKIHRTNAFVQVAARMQYLYLKQLSVMLDDLLSDGSEGLILRKSSSRYVHGRSNLLWKLKAARGDMEGLVVSVDTSNHTYLLQLPDNTTFQAPSQIVEEDEMPKKGDVVTFSFENLSNRSVPVNPEIVRVRADLVWRDVVREFARNKMNDSMQKQTNYSMKPRGYWDPTRNKHMRLFFETYAKHRQLDPLVPDTWYSLTAEASLQKEARYVLAHFKGSHIKALMAVFPEIGLKETKFPFASKDYWSSVATRREVFCEFAKQQNFDPLLPENWYSVPVFSLLVYKNLRSVVEKYNGNLTKTLMHLFPDIGLDEQKLPKIPDKYYYGKDYQKNLVIFAHQNKHNKKFANSSSLDISQDVVSLLQRGVPHRSKRYWSKAKNQKAFFEKFAKEMGFNPQVPENWYSVSGAAVLCHIGGSAILSFYESLPHALITLYPNIGLKSYKFLRLPKKYWDDTRNQKEFFDSYAEEKNFDPSMADNWYSSTFDDLLSKPATKILLKRYGGSHVRALIAAYPSLDLDPHKFFAEVRENAADIDARREILLSYAKDKLFDALVPDNWYSTTATDILKWREKTTVLSPYGGNVTSALLHLFPNIGLDISKFDKLPKEYWKEPHNRRLFFEEFAKKHKFDPLNAHMWYSVSLENVLNVKKATSVLSFYNKDLPKALLDLFPDIGLDPALLKRY